MEDYFKNFLIASTLSGILIGFFDIRLPLLGSLSPLPVIRHTTSSFLSIMPASTSFGRAARHAAPGVLQIFLQDAPTNSWLLKFPHLKTYSAFPLDSFNALSANGAS